MILPTPGPMDYGQMFGSETTLGPQNSLPVRLDVSTADVLKGLNPLHHVPVLGTMYRLATGETIPMPMRVLGAGITGGGLGMIGAAFMGLIEELIRMGPDTSRPAAPSGLAQTGSEA